MIRCTFAGHREVLQSGIREAVLELISTIILRDTEFEFYCGGMGEFDALCAAAVRIVKREHRNVAIKLFLVEPYMKQSINSEKEHLEMMYDDIIIPMELAGVYYKKAITERNHWMVDNSQILIAFVYRSFGGAYAMLRYAEKQGLEIYNVAPKM